jgi:hypothetical protein
MHSSTIILILPCSVNALCIYVTMCIYRVFLNYQFESEMSNECKSRNASEKLQRMHVRGYNAASYEKCEIIE